MRGAGNLDRELYRKALPNAAETTTPRRRSAAPLTTLTLLAGITAVEPDRPRAVETVPTAGGALVGTMVQLTSDDRRYPALHRPGQRPAARGGVLLVPAPGSNADDPDVVRPLRLGLADAGWDTLSLQLPPPLAGERPENWLSRHQSLVPRLVAGLDWLRQRGLQDLVLLTVGPSVHGAITLIDQGSPSPVSALVMISAPSVIGRDGADRLTAFGMPLLDVYAERDRPDVLEAVRRRRDVTEPAPDQRMLVGSVVGFSHNGDYLVATVRAWLFTHVFGP